MLNIFRIFISDFKRIKTNVVAVVIVIGLSILPCLYAYFIELEPVWTGCNVEY